MRALCASPWTRPTAFLVTGSEDKTVRVWDISGRGELLRILRPPVGEGEVGKIYAVALSPDGGTVACGGLTGSPNRLMHGCFFSTGQRAP